MKYCVGLEEKRWMALLLDQRWGHLRTALRHRRLWLQVGVGTKWYSVDGQSESEVWSVVHK